MIDKVSIMDALTNPKMQWRERCILAWLRTSGDWHGLEQMHAAFGLSKNMSELCLKMVREGYVERKMVAGRVFYRVKHETA